MENQAIAQATQCERKGIRTRPIFTGSPSTTTAPENVNCTNFTNFTNFTNGIMELWTFGHLRLLDALDALDALDTLNYWATCGRVCLVNLRIARCASGDHRYLFKFRTLM